MKRGRWDGRRRSYLSDQYSAASIGPLCLRQSILRTLAACPLPVLPSRKRNLRPLEGSSGAVAGANNSAGQVRLWRLLSADLLPVESMLGLAECCRLSRGSRGARVNVITRMSIRNDSAGSPFARRSTRSGQSPFVCSHVSPVAWVACDQHVADISHRPGCKPQVPMDGGGVVAQAAVTVSRIGVLFPVCEVVGPFAMKDLRQRGRHSLCQSAT